jgi:hypothetical protein
MQEVRLGLCGLSLEMAVDWPDWKGRKPDYPESRTGGRGPSGKALPWISWSGNHNPHAVASFGKTTFCPPIALATPDEHLLWLGRVPRGEGCPRLRLLRV